MTREELLPIAKPILFNTDMVRAILDGRKSETRRVVKPQPEGRMYPMPMVSEWPHYFGCSGSDGLFRPAYYTGDILYVRETWRLNAAKRYESLVRIGYRAGGPITAIQFPNGGTDSIDRGAYDAFVDKWLLDRWHPSIHMPKEAARIFLRVTDVWVERLQDISNKEAKLEGVSVATDNSGQMHRFAFYTLWQSTIPKKNLDKYGWKADPWVWVIQFERVEV